MKTAKYHLQNITIFVFTATLLYVALLATVVSDASAYSASKEINQRGLMSPMHLMTGTIHEGFESDPDLSSPDIFVRDASLVRDTTAHAEGNASWKCDPSANFGYCYTRIRTSPQEAGLTESIITGVDVSFRISATSGSNPSIDLVLGNPTEPDAERYQPFTDWLDISIFNISDAVTSLALECGEKACDQHFWKSINLAEPPDDSLPWRHLSVDIEDRFEGNDIVRVYLNGADEPIITATVQLLDKFDTVHLYATNDNSVNLVPMWWDDLTIRYSLSEFKRIYQSISDEGVALTYFLPEPDELNSVWGHDYRATVYTDSNGEAIIPQQILKMTPSATHWEDPYINTGIYNDPSNNHVKFQGEYWTSTKSECAGNNPSNWPAKCVKRIAYEHPNLWWILGEEDNFWFAGCSGSMFDGNACRGSYALYLSPEAYSHWLKTVTDDIQAGWQKSGVAESERGKIIGFYLVNSNIPGSITLTHPITYLDAFKQEWDKGNGISGSWGEVPIDGVDFNLRPAAYDPNGDIEIDSNQPPSPLDEAKMYWEKRRSEMETRSWLADKFMWGETNQPRARWDYETSSNYWRVVGQGTDWEQTYMDQDAIRCDVANYLGNLLEWGEQSDRPWFDGLQWFATAAPTGVPDDQFYWEWNNTYPFQRDEDASVPFGWAYYSSLYDTALYAGNGIGLIPQEGDLLTVVGETFKTGRSPYSCRSANVQVWTDFDDTPIELYEFESHIASHSPKIEDYLVALRSARDPGEVYGERIQAILHPPTTGNYTFWIAARDEGALFLSTTPGHLHDPDYATEIASIKTQNCNSGTDPFDWDQCGSQQSAAIYLEADKTYYIETLHVANHDEDDHVSVAWQIPGEDRTLISGDYLSPFGYEDAWRFRGYAYLGEDGDPPVGLPGVLLKLYGYASGETPPGDLLKTTVSDNSGFWNFHITEAPYDYYRIVAEIPENTVITNTWSESGSILSPSEIEWFHPKQQVHLNAFYFDSTPTVHVYQQGVLGYYGVHDTDLDAWEPDATHSSATALRLRTTHDNNPPPVDQEVQSPVISFADIDASNAQQATLSVYAIGQSNEGDLFAHVASILQPVEADTATWNQYDSSNVWQLAGAREEGVDRTGSTDVHSVGDVPEGGQWLDFDVTSLVQQGHNDFMLYARHNWVNVQKNMASSEYWDTLKRPKLTLFDEAPPDLIEDVYQQGVNGYNGGEDTYLDAWSPDNDDVYWMQYLRLRTTGSANPVDQEVRSPLIRFTGVDYDNLESASLSVYVYGQSNGCQLQAYVAGVSQPFDVQDATWNQYATGFAWGQAGARSETDRTAPVDDRNVPDVSAGGQWINFDVTTLVEQGIYDFILYARHTSCNVGKVLASHEYWDASKRPKLTIAHY